MSDDKKKTDARKTIPLRLSPELWEQLNRWAQDDFRSINGQIEYLLTECVKKRYGRSKEQERREREARQMYEMPEKDDGVGE